ncbi:MAG: glycosyltransferase [Halobacteria archaeon]
MKIALFGPGSEFLSGISYYTANLARALSEEHEVTVVLFRKMLPRIIFPGRERVGAPIASLDYGRARVLPLDWHNPGTWLIAFRAIRSCDAWVLPWWTASVFHLYLALNLLRRGPKLVVEFHEILDPLEARNPGLRWYTKAVCALLLKQASSAVVHSEADRGVVAESFGLDASVVPHGLFEYPRVERPEARRRLGIPEPRVLLYFGIVRRYKGLPVLLDAFDRLPESLARETRLLLVGEPWDDEVALRARIAASPRAGQITWVDRYVSDDEIPHFFGAADAVVLPYLRASQSGVAHIAIAQGLPVVLSRVGGLESLGEYSGATLVEPGDPAGLVAALERVLRQGPRAHPAPPLGFRETARRYTQVLERARGIRGGERANP